MYTILRLEYKNITTYMMILVDNLCSNYDFLTYDFSKNIFVNESFTTDSFIGKNAERISEMIETIGRLLEQRSLETLMYEDIREFEEMDIESIHVPESYQFIGDYFV